MKKKICVALFFVVTLYAYAELTRFILVAQKNVIFAPYIPNFKLEVSLIWLCYVIMMVLFNIILWTPWEDEPEKPCPRCGERMKLTITNHYTGETLWKCDCGVVGWDGQVK